MTAVGVTPSPLRWAAISSLDLAESGAGSKSTRSILLIDDRHLLDAEQMQQIAVPPRLLAHALGGVDNQQRGIGLRRRR